MPSTSLSMLLYMVSVLHRLLLAKNVGYSAALTGNSSFGQIMPSLTCNRPIPKLTPDASASKCSRSLSLYVFVDVCFGLVV